MLSEPDKQIAHNVIAKLFDLKVRDMGGGLRIVELGQKWLPVEERNLIVAALRELLAEQ
jgi:hypothetical protein